MHLSACSLQKLRPLLQYIWIYLSRALGPYKTGLARHLLHKHRLTGLHVIPQADLDDNDNEPLLVEGSMESPDSMPLKAYRQGPNEPCCRLGGDWQSVASLYLNSCTPGRSSNSN